MNVIQRYVCMYRFVGGKKHSTKTENRIRCKSLCKTFVLVCISSQGSCNLTTRKHYEWALFCFAIEFGSTGAMGQAKV